MNEKVENSGLKLKILGLVENFFAICKAHFLYASMVAFIFGLALAGFFGFEAKFVAPLAVLSAALFLLSLIFKKFNLLLIVFAILGANYVGLAVLETASFPTSVNKATFISGKIVDISEDSDNYLAELQSEFVSTSNTYTVKGSDNTGWNGKVYLLAGDTDLYIGDEISFAALVVDYTDNQNFGIEQVDYMRNNGIGAILQLVPNSLVVESLAPKYSLTNIASNVKAEIYQSLEQFPTNQQALIKGIAFGDKTMLTGSSTNILSQTGLMHIFAVSGLHIGYVVLFAAFLVSMINTAIRLNPYVKVALTSGFVIFFAAMVGFSPSVTRAVIMSIAAYIGVTFGENTSIRGSIIVAAFACLIYEPVWIYNLGFQLSFLATFGIVYTSSFWAAFFKPRGFQIAIAAQSMTLPLVAQSYYLISIIGIFISPIIAVGAGFIVMMTLLAMIFAIFGLAAIPLTTAGLMAELLFEIASFLQGIPGAFFMVQSPSTLMIFTYYALLFVALYFMHRCNLKSLEVKNLEAKQIK